MKKFLIVGLGKISGKNTFGNPPVTLVLNSWMPYPVQKVLTLKLGSGGLGTF